MKLGATYICVSDIQKSLKFYTNVLNMRPTFINEDRWVQFNCGNTLALYNAEYDEKILNAHLEKEHFNDEYVNKFKQEVKEEKINNMVIFNFYVEDIQQEYERIKNLGIAVSELMYVNIFKPYWYFTIKDPDGNELLEINE